MSAKVMRLISLILSSVVTIATLGACGPTSPAGTSARVDQITATPSAQAAAATQAATEATTTLTVSAASDLTPAFGELGDRFTQETGINVTFNFGSTGQLAQQIAQGAPVDLFAAANISFIDDLEAQGLIIPDTKTRYARGRIALWTRADSPLTLDQIEDLADPDVERVAIANPEHAPYGIAAREAIQNAGIWDEVEPKLVFAENVAQTLTLADTGNVDAAIVALSLSVQSNGRWKMISDTLHTPLDQALAVISGTSHEQAARQFATFVNSATGRSIMEKYGFTLPDEESNQ